MDTTGLLGFYLLTAFISLSGVMMPGPVFAGTVAKGYKDKNAGMQIALGHGLVEFPLIGLIGLGLGSFFENQGVRLAIGVIGGAVLIYIGYNMVRMRKETDETEKYLPYHPIIVGVITTVSNPYFFLWWATVGLFLIVFALGFGLLALVVFAVVHWLCDFIWDYFVSFTVFKSKRLWSEKGHNIVFGICGAIMVIFGVWFIISSI
ncbi:MAG: LysE family transporter [Methanomassiliicoccales archaeon]|nr:MAG: LysE family transporter [Methanomassiliicoccales archaeon]